jgi:hypothetical protein
MRHDDNMNGLGAGLSGLDPMWGALIASGISTAGALGARLVAAPGSTVSQWSEGVGLLVGSLASAAMLAMPATRDAGKFGFAFVLVNQGLRLLEKVLRGGSPVGWVVTQQEQMHGGVGMPSMQQMNGGLGHTMAVNQPPRLAGGAVAGPGIENGQPPNVNMMGGQMNGFGLSGLYGATIMGSR